MDSSLAKGIKNQLFREIDEDIAAFIKRWKAYVQKSKPQKSRSNWRDFSKGVESVYAQYILASYFGGSERKPFLCLSTFENSEREFNTWKERCLSSKVLYFNFDPIGVNSEPSGFNISEHAIQRIFERTYSDVDPLAEGFKKIDFTNELRMAPMWSFFWSLEITKLKNDQDQFDRKIDIVIPALSGLFLGQISTLNIQKSEIRTFVSKEQLSSKQLLIWELMLKISKKYINSVIPFLYFEFIYAKPGSLDCAVEFLKDTNELRELLICD